MPSSESGEQEVREALQLADETTCCGDITVLYVHSYTYLSVKMRDWLHDRGILGADVRFLSGYEPESDAVTRLFVERKRVQREFTPFDGDDDIGRIDGVPAFTTREMNRESVRELSQRVSPDLTILFGAGILSEETIDSIPGKVWNVHAGLTPRYRGIHTHFWPCYNGEPNWVGMTVHEVTPEIDLGPVVHQSRAEMQRGDTFQRLSSRTMNSFIEDDLPRLLSLFKANELEPPRRQTDAGVLWRAADLRKPHAEYYRERIGDSVVDRYLDNSDGEEDAPDLHEQF